MFMDGKRSGEAVPPSVEGFTAFVSSKDPDEQYDWPDHTECPCAQYARSIGKDKEWFAPPTDEDFEFWEGINKLARPGLGIVGTFGRLAQLLNHKI